MYVTDHACNVVLYFTDHTHDVVLYFTDHTRNVVMHCINHNFDILNIFFIQALIMMSRLPDPADADNGNTYDEDSAVFFLELLVKIILQNRQVANNSKIIDSLKIMPYNITNYKSFEVISVILVLKNISVLVFILF